MHLGQKEIFQDHTYRICLVPTWTGTDQIHKFYSLQPQSHPSMFQEHTDDQFHSQYQAGKNTRVHCKVCRQTAVRVYVGRKSVPHCIRCMLVDQHQFDSIPLGILSKRQFGCTSSFRCQMFQKDMSSGHRLYNRIQHCKLCGYSHHKCNHHHKLHMFHSFCTWCCRNSTDSHFLVGALIEWIHGPKRVGRGDPRARKPHALEEISHPSSSRMPCAR